MTDTRGMAEMSEEERLQAQIARTRAELGETVEALAAKANVPARVKRRGAELGHEAQAKMHELGHEAQVKAHEAQERARQAPVSWWIAAGSGVAALIALIVFLRGRS